MLLPAMLITHPTALHTNATPASSNSRSHNFGASFHVIGDAMEKVHTLIPLVQITFLPLHNHMSLVLHNLLRVPSITINFIRVSRFSRDNNVYFQFNANESLVKSQETGDILLQECLIGANSHRGFNWKNWNNSPRGNKLQIMDRGVIDLIPPKTLRLIKPHNNLILYAPIEGFDNGDPSMVCKLNKELYGLKQAPR
ncbi:hypothetical protein MTR_5g032530 [Medicago truncatula]|uniref:Uncharacterized protein n=1 Tax=Medicago truncatula TaxID=3880 RepID=G7JXR0_MEDTR|nr:hypothetical protein MTR_5g032530 [Medicago truncatula]